MPNQNLYGGPSLANGINNTGYMGGSGISGMGRNIMQNSPSGFDKFNKFIGSQNFANYASLANLGMGAFGMFKGLGLAEDQVDIQKSQEQRAADAQRLQTGNSLAMALATTTPGTPEHERAKAEYAKYS